MTAIPTDGHVGLQIAEGVARITIDRPAHLNALNNDIRAKLTAAVDEAAAVDDVRVVVLAGAGRKAFAAGADIDELLDLTPEASLALSRAIATLHDKIESIPIPVVAAIRGWCLGGGLELALTADIRIAAETARLGLPEIKLGILPGGGGISRMARVAGMAAAQYLCLTGGVVDARRALELGLVSEVHGDDAFDARIKSAEAALASLSRPALRAMKKALRCTGKSHLAEAVRQEAQVGAGLYGSREQRDAMSGFLAARARKAKLE